MNHARVDIGAHQVALPYGHALQAGNRSFGVGGMGQADVDAITAARLHFFRVGRQHPVHLYGHLITHNLPLVFLIAQGVIPRVQDSAQEPVFQVVHAPVVDLVEIAF